MAKTFISYLQLVFFSKVTLQAKCQGMAKERNKEFSAIT